jgi:hypothetical protein
MVAWRHDFVAVFGVMQDHDAVPHGAVQCNHGVMQKGSDCEIFADLVYFALKFQKRVNCSHFHQIRPWFIHLGNWSSARLVGYMVVGRLVCVEKILFFVGCQTRGVSPRWPARTLKHLWPRENVRIECFSRDRSGAHHEAERCSCFQCQAAWQSHMACRKLP